MNESGSIIHTASIFSAEANTHAAIGYAAFESMEPMITKDPKRSTSSHPTQGRNNLPQDEFEYP